VQPDEKDRIIETLREENKVKDRKIEELMKQLNAA
jgi:hypothetical protein